jgi:hypothetical protein
VRIENGMGSMTGEAGFDKESKGIINAADLKNGR